MDSGRWLKTLKGLLDIFYDGESKTDGLAAYNEFNNLITLKMIESRMVNKEYEDMPEECYEDCIFSNLYEKYCSPDKIKEDEKNEYKPGYKPYHCKLYDILYNRERIYATNYNENGEEVTKRNNELPCVFDRVFCHTPLHNVIMPKHRKAGYTVLLPKHSKDLRNVFVKIHNAFEEVSLDEAQFDALGDAYEQMMADEVGNKGKRTGQYFTAHTVRSLVVDELKPKSNEVVYDPACGTGGFLISAMNYVKKHEPNQLAAFIQNNIMGQEIQPEVVKTLCFNMMIHQMEECLENLNEGDSIRDLQFNTRMKGKVDVVTANPPYGMTMKCKYPDYFEVKATNSVALFLQHIYHCLKPNGRAGVVIDQGILTNGNAETSWEVSMRRFMLEKTNMYKIILLPDGIFKHTSFSTAIVYFEKGEPTKEVEFIEGYFADKTAKKASDMKLMDGVKVSINDIKKKTWSLNLKEYTKGDDEKKNNKMYVKLGDLVDLKVGNFNSKDMSNSGNVPFYTASANSPVGFHNEHTLDLPEYIIFMKDGGNKNDPTSLSCGLAKTYLVQGKTAFTTTQVALVPKKDTNMKYLHTYLTFHRQSMMKLAKYGSGLGHIGTGAIKEFPIKLPTPDVQQRIVDYLDEKTAKYDLEPVIKVFGHLDIMELLVKDRHDIFDIIFRQQELQTMYDLIRVSKDAIIRCMLDTVKGTKVKLEDVAIINPESLSTKDKLDHIKYIDLSAINKGQIMDIKHLPLSEASSRAKRKVKIDDILVGMVRPNLQNHAMINEAIYDTTLIASTGFAIVRANTSKVLPLYLFKKIMTDEVTRYFEFKASGQAYPAICAKDVANLMIKLPTLEDQQKIVDKIHQIEAPDHHYQVYGKCLQDEMDNMLKLVESVVKSIQLDETVEDIVGTPDVSDNETVISDSEADEEVQPKPKKKSSKKDVDEDKPKKKSSKKDATEDKPKKKSSKKDETDTKPKKKTSKKDETDTKPKKKTSKKDETDTKPKKKTSKKDATEDKPKKKVIV
jgi:type I restriction-modification system DNA methylase subunit/restriction endonuclease S subunit